MKHTTIQSIKFSRLKRKLQLTQWQAVGVLEAIWQFTALNAPGGDIGRHTNEDIAVGIEWAGDADSLIGALVETGWLDRMAEPVRLYVHDWLDHCPGWIKSKLVRAKDNPDWLVAKLLEAGEADAVGRRATPGATRLATPLATPGVTPRATPRATPAVARDGVAARATRGATPAATQPATPGATPAVATGVTPGATPAATTGAAGAREPYLTIPNQTTLSPPTPSQNPDTPPTAEDDPFGVPSPPVDRFAGSLAPVRHFEQFAAAYPRQHYRAPSQTRSEYAVAASLVADRTGEGLEAAERWLLERVRACVSLTPPDRVRWLPDLRRWLQEARYDAPDESYRGADDVAAADTQAAYEARRAQMIQQAEAAANGGGR